MTRKKITFRMEADMLERLSKFADEVLKLSKVIAREYGQDHVGTEHLLLAMARLGQGGAADFLLRHRLDEPTLRGYLTDLLQAQMEEKTAWVFGRLPGTPHLQNVMERAIGEAQVASSHLIGTNHLLLGLLHEKDSVAQQMLAKAGLVMERVRPRLITHTDVEPGSDVTTTQ